MVFLDYCSWFSRMDGWFVDWIYILVVHSFSGIARLDLVWIMSWRAQIVQDGGAMCSREIYLFFDGGWNLRLVMNITFGHLVSLSIFLSTDRFAHQQFHNSIASVLKDGCSWWILPSPLVSFFGESVVRAPWLLIPSPWFGLSCCSELLPWPLPVFYLCAAIDNLWSLSSLRSLSDFLCGESFIISRETCSTF